MIVNVISCVVILAAMMSIYTWRGGFFKYLYLFLGRTSCEVWGGIHLYSHLAAPYICLYHIFAYFTHTYTPSSLCSCAVLKNSVVCAVCTCSAITLHCTGFVRSFTHLCTHTTPHTYHHRLVRGYYHIMSSQTDHRVLCLNLTRLTVRSGVA